MSGAILVVEDEPVTRRLIAACLERAGYAVRGAGNLPEAEAAISAVVPDVVLLDWMLPNGTGVSLLRRLRAEGRTKRVPIIMLTGRSSEIDKVTGLEAGADDYITKPYSHRELLARIKAVVRRRAPLLDEEPVAFGDLVLDPAARRVTAGGLRLELWATEFKLLHFFMRHPNHVFTRGQLLTDVWGDHVFISDRTVDVHIRRIRQALEPSGHARRIETVRGTGYCFRGGSDDGD
jgi:two-component system phosphate regulon response regulator PhoB